MCCIQCDILPLSVPFVIIRYYSYYISYLITTSCGEDLEFHIDKIFYLIRVTLQSY